MSLPRGTNSRVFYRAAKQRFSDAEFLLEHDRTRSTSAVYLAGYGVECMLKVLLLESVTESRHQAITGFFHGQQGHDLIMLMREIRRRSPGTVPLDIEHTLRRLNTWTTNLRYSPGAIKTTVAKGFIRDAGRVIQWADERI